MIVGIGIDMVRIDRLRRWVDMPGLLERYFHSDELVSVMSKGSGKASSLAARFAAKEAFGKALGTGLLGIVLKDIMVLNRNNGRPEIKVFGTALKALRESGASRVHVSLAHEHDNAVAMVILEDAGD
ncbi:MAG: holo-ACP synthase [Treponema sp.]|jgi:holo-[acyl-carrier protein] synthase|nr:holo-ACP synthase [Treponema sp.]